MIEAHYAGLFLSGPLEWTPLCEKLMEKVIYNGSGRRNQPSSQARHSGPAFDRRLGFTQAGEDLLWAEEQGTIPGELSP